MAPIDEKNPLGLPDVIEGADESARQVRRAMQLIDSDPAVREAVGKAKVGNPISVTVVPTGDQMAEKLIRRATQAGDDWVKGVQNPSADFKEAGIRAAGKHKTRTMEALNEDRYRKGLAKVDVNEAIDTAVRVGASGYSAGVQAREAKIKRVMSDLSPRIAAVKRAIDAMPQDTDAQREQRLLAARKNMIEVGKARRGG